MTTLVGEINEFELIRILLETLGPQAVSVGIGSRVIAGAGDDCAVSAPAPSMLALQTTDTMVEGIHFLREMPAEDLGWKSLASNVSDIAAMGGLPTTALVTLAIPPSLPLDWLRAWYRGMAECGAQFGVSITGGDIVRTQGDVCITVSLSGEVEPSLIAFRSGAGIGDVLIVTGTPGDSAAGLWLLLAGKAPPERLRNAHLRPRPRLLEARQAVQTGHVTAMMDVSDGPGGDLRHLCEASGVGAVVDAALLPISPEMQHAALDLGRDPLELAISGGEDYELLLAAPPQWAAEVLEAIAAPGSTRGTVIGRITDASEGIRLAGPLGAQPMPRSFAHFQGPSEPSSERSERSDK